MAGGAHTRGIVVRVCRPQESGVTHRESGRMALVAIDADPVMYRGIGMALRASSIGSAHCIVASGRSTSRWVNCPPRMISSSQEGSVTRSIGAGVTTSAVSSGWDVCSYLPLRVQRQWRT